MKEIKLVILDRDGVINHDSDHYIRSPEEYIPIESSLRAIAAIHAASIPVVVATNQSGVGRGYYTQATLDAIHGKMHEALKEFGACVNAVYYCPHIPTDVCECRKPNPGLLQMIAKEYPEAFPSAIMVGDSWSDWEVAKRCGVEPYLVLTGKGERTLASHGHKIPKERVFRDLASVVEQVVGLSIRPFLKK
jgi:D-glycero-D-manno-heptose 1,7-bisphosphate phosphatase